ncbi:uncharacterized protein LOC131947193 [Physella acuta]|uniref:uncharacterized protein LOC131947193 n=1 Tax=Physella acuta TaxID=109671 RepID=UPI0027DACFB6|nr:uncharacterized protein LOC131947193 [Physella acuta]
MENMKFVLLLVTLMTLMVLARCGPWCGSGEFKAAHRCEPCRNGTYQDEVRHQEKECKPCQDADVTKGEQISQACTSRSRSVLGCKAGYYIKGRGDLGTVTCRRCTQCRSLYVARHCGGQSDTICCPRPGMKAFKVENDVIQCFREEPTKRITFTKSVVCEDNEVTLRLKCQARGFPRRIQLVQPESGRVYDDWHNTKRRLRENVTLYNYDFPNLGKNEIFACIVMFKDGSNRMKTMRFKDTCTG